MCVCVRAHAQSCQILCNLMDYSLPGSSVHVNFQARILEWVAIFFSRGSSQPRDRTHISRTSCTAGGFFATVPPGESILIQDESKRGRLQVTVI